jgi:iron(III) transport system permease protein
VLQAVALFGSPAILALPAGFHTLTTQIWGMFHYPPRTETAAAISIPLLLATALLLLLQRRLLGRRGYAAVGGKGGQRRRVALGAWRMPALVVCVAVLACAVLLPYGILAWAAFSRAWTQPLTWDNLTLRNWTFTFLEYSIFIGVIRELSASIILFTPATKVMSVVIFDLKEEGQFGAIAVLGVFMLIMTFAVVLLMQRVLGRDFMGARE